MELQRKQWGPEGVFWGDNFRFRYCKLSFHMPFNLLLLMLTPYLFIEHLSKLRNELIKEWNFIQFHQFF